MRKVILGLSFSIALILVGDFYRPVSNLVIAQIAADIKARKPTLLTQPSPFEDLSELDVLAESENVMLFADINPQAPLTTSVCLSTGFIRSWRQAQML